MTISAPRPNPRPAIRKVSVTHTKSGATLYTNSWKWNIKAGTFQKMPDFCCPSGEPRVAKGRQFEQSGFYANMGQIEASAASGTGYNGFDHAFTSEYSGALYKWQTMNGWPEGGWFYNSVWAPVFESGHFELTVTCTSLDTAGAAHVLRGFDANFFPWKN